MSVLVALCALLIGDQARASLTGDVERAVIDFETGFSDRQTVPTIEVAGVKVSIGTSSWWGGNAYIAEVGGRTTAINNNDTPSGDGAGNFFVTDQWHGGLFVSHDYIIEFSEEVQNVTLDAYDVNTGNGSRRGDTMTLSAYDSMNRLIGSDTYTITGDESDGNVITFGVDITGITRVELVHSGRDGSTGIDNITFGITVAAAPEPAEWAMLISGALVLGAGLRRQGRKAPSA